MSLRKRILANMRHARRQMPVKQNRPQPEGCGRSETTSGA